MMIHAIADLHLDPGGKSMGVFGERWENHAERIASCWQESVMAEDLVLVPGDISWAMRLSEATEHLQWIGSLPGHKLILRGNHDYWWSSLSRVREALPQGVWALQNDSFQFGDHLIAGSRGWLLPGEETTQEDAKVYQRELMRLEMSLMSARARSQSAPLVAMMHFPPLTQEQQETGFTRLFERFGASHVVYGHLHGAALRGAFRGEKGGVVYHQVSSDGLEFCPKCIT